MGIPWKNRVCVIVETDDGIQGIDEAMDGLLATLGREGRSVLSVRLPQVVPVRMGPAQRRAGSTSGIVTRTGGNHLGGR